MDTIATPARIVRSWPGARGPPPMPGTGREPGNE